MHVGAPQMNERAPQVHEIKSCTLDERKRTKIWRLFILVQLGCSFVHLGRNNVHNFLIDSAPT